jgi:hypothetical protein
LEAVGGSGRGDPVRQIFSFLSILRVFGESTSHIQSGATEIQLWGSSSGYLSSFHPARSGTRKEKAESTSTPRRSLPGTPDQSLPRT